VLNQQIQVRLLSGAQRSRASVPASAIVEDGVERVVYVMRGGESFSRVVVRTGLRDGDYVELIEGPAPGERVVSRGALQVRRAAATPDAMGHGHAH
jgi:multidrug efflux pump subunit AcrA (membrane-fusion protein)